MRFFLWGLIKDMIYVPSLSITLHELRQRIIVITLAVKVIDRDTLQPVWAQPDNHNCNTF